MRATARRLFCLIAMAPLLAGAGSPVPALVEKDGRYALVVDGKPYLVLGAQANNSSNYAAMLPKVWPAVSRMRANTLVMPVAWEQVEPREGEFDFSFVDRLIEEARANEVRLVLLWFATWKNNAPKYTPEWVKLDNQRFPRVITDDGRTLDSMSPHFRSTLEADKRAYVALLRHLERTDDARTVIMMQIQNETGTYSSVRDFSPTANALIAGDVPSQLVADLGLSPGRWHDVLGADADEAFHAWHIARYCNEIAAAGKAVYPLPVYVNVALRNPLDPGKPGSYSSGGPTDNMLDVWKSGAPAIDMISPDIYFREHDIVSRVLDLYARDDNPLYVSEIGNDQPYARYFFAALGKHAIGFAPFGMDYSDYSNFPLGARALDDETLAHFSRLYDLFMPMADVWAKLSFEARVWGAAEPDSSHTQLLDLGRWQAKVEYGLPMFGNPEPQGNDPPSGGIVIAELGDDEFLLTGFDARVRFEPAEPDDGRNYLYVRVEEGHFENGEWVFERVWNGDQVDWGLNLSGNPHILKVRLGSYATNADQAR
jgi:beta-galactosidase GanA